MGKLSKDKGKRGERELAAELTRVLGITARRGQQYSGGSGSPDVITDIGDVHIECKRTERLQIYKALEQSAADAGGQDTDCLPSAEPATVGRFHSVGRLAEIYHKPIKR